MVGSEGLAGPPLVLGVDRTPHPCMIQAPGVLPASGRAICRRR